jgi:hypothetical protein
MTDQKWIPIKKKAKHDEPSTKKVRKSGLKALRGRALDKSVRQSTQVTYEVNGAWKGIFTFANNKYDTLAVPRATVTNDEGYPEIPQEGIFVALPIGASNVQVEVVQKKMQEVEGDWHLKPAPKPITEKEYLEGKEEYKPNAKVYDSNKDYPGKDFDFLGLRSLEGVQVAHIMVFLAQYKPKTGKLSVVETMILEISYDVPPQSDAVPRARSVNPMLSDMILDYDNIQKATFNSERKENLTIGYAQPVLGEVGHITTGVVPNLAGLVEAVAAHEAIKSADIICEYAIITTEALKAAVTPLLNAKKGWPHYARVITTPTIQAAFPAANLKESIRSFLAWAWDNWTVPPRYVVLAGDVDTIPVHIWNFSGVNYASDHYYADVKGDLSPEIVVSRLPTSDLGTMQQICQRLAQYSSQRGPDWGGWENEVVLVAYQADTYKTCSDEIATMISPRFRVTKLYGDSSTRQQVINKMNAGVLFANYRGHGSQVDWSSANGLRTSDIHNLTNGNMPPMVFCICCENAWIDAQGVNVVVETFLRDGKCVAIFGASRDSPTYANNDFNKYIWRAIMDYGETEPGGIIKRAKALMVQNNGTSNTHKSDVIMYMLFGDPTARVASDVEFLRGTWDMDHDGWRGKLVINRIWQSRVEKIGTCGYPVWSISGTYKGQGNTEYPMTGKIGGKDPNDQNPGCKRSDHKISFTIAFPNNNQTFDGYVHTWTRNVMDGFTRWSKRPFGWYAKKQ